MTQYRKKPVVIEAVQFTGMDRILEGQDRCGRRAVF